MKVITYFAAATMAGALLCCGDALAGQLSSDTPEPVDILHRFVGIGYVVNIHSQPIITTTYDGSFSRGALIQASDGNFYGTTQLGGSGVCDYTVGICVGSGTVYRMTVNFATGQATESLVYSFQGNGQDGVNPTAGLVQGADGSLYGTTYAGGTGACNGGCGTVFRISIDPKTGVATETVLHSFQNDGKDGLFPYAGLIQGKDGKFYGTTLYGGSGSCSFPLSPNGCGTAFSISVDPITGAATEKVVYSFQSNGVDGHYPAAALMQGSDGSFYGTTVEGGTAACPYPFTSLGCGAVFRISVNPSTDASTESTLYSFGSSSDDGTTPLGSIIQDSKGDLYGTTSVGGGGTPVGGIGGTVFRLSIDPSTGAVTHKTVYAFKDVPDGSSPAAGLLLGHDGNFYGTTQMGGTGQLGCVRGCGTVFRLSIDAASGDVSETVLHSFIQSEGIEPMANLIQGSDGNLYSTTSGPSVFFDGSAFRIAP